jgi:hypothetical protein
MLARHRLRGRAVTLGLLSLLIFPASGLGASKRSADIKRIHQYRQVTWHWQKVMGHRPSPTNHHERWTTSDRYRSWLVKMWKKRANRVVRIAKNPPHFRSWMCIHRGEGAWTSATGNGYYGGLQMDISFQRTYGWYLLRTKGTANRWSPLEQIWVAEKARRSGRGFHPWPNTARRCGLI